MEASLIQTETTKDFNGSNLSAVSYQYQAGTPIPGKERDENGVITSLPANLALRSELPVVPIYIPAMIRTYRTRVTNKDEDELEALNKAYQGFVNDGAWRGYNARTWLCVGLTWRTTDFRSTFNVDLRFQYKFDTFDAEVVFRDPYSGKVPGDVFSQASAYESYRIQPEANFDTLLSALGI